ncbi:putative low-complexity protein [Leptolyngbya sp. PCC 7375]|nr:putative low-complexity protein [Leptolyngbya sp. PCC 7375]
MTLKTLAIALGLTPLLLVAPTGVGASDIDAELYNLCSKFPFNSRCEGYEIPVPLENRGGSGGECSLVFGDVDQSSACKFTLSDETLTLYVEEGEPLSLLGNERATRERSIPLDQIFALNYLEYDQDNYGSALAFGLIGALFARSEQVAEVEIGFTSESDAGQTNYNFLLVTTDQDTGTDFRTQLEQSTNVQPGSPADDIVAAWLAAAESTADNNELVQQLMQTRDCENCDLQGADLRQSDLSQVNLEGANLERANLENVSLVDANLEGANLRGANLENAVLSSANLTTEGRLRTSLRYANLRNADLTSTKLKGADLGRANLSGANLTDANLGSAVNTNSWTGMTRTIHTNLSGANLSEANLSQANLKQAFLGNADLSRANLAGTDLEDATLDNANLQEANLSSADLEDASLIGANLLGANLSEADLEDTNFCGATMPDGSISDQGCE